MIKETAYSFVYSTKGENCYKRFTPQHSPVSYAVCWSGNISNQDRNKLDTLIKKQVGTVGREQVTFISKQERQIINRVQYIFGDETHLLISEFDNRRIDRKNIYKIHTLEPRVVVIH